MEVLSITTTPGSYLVVLPHQASFHGLIVTNSCVMGFGRRIISPAPTALVHEPHCHQPRTQRNSDSSLTCMLLIVTLLETVALRSVKKRSRSWCSAAAVFRHKCKRCEMREYTILFINRPLSGDGRCPALGRIRSKLWRSRWARCRFPAPDARSDCRLRFLTARLQKQAAGTGGMPLRGPNPDRPTHDSVVVTSS